MGQPRRHASLASKSLAVLRCIDGWGEHLHGDQSLEAVLPREVYDTHSTASQKIEKLVLSTERILDLSADRVALFVRALPLFRCRRGRAAMRAEVS